MREVITLQIGQGGNQVGCRFWQTICDETELDGSGKPKDTFNDIVADKIDVYFHETAGRYVPRNILVDLEPGTTDVIKASPYGQIFKPDNYCFGSNGAGNNWAKGHYTEGAELVDTVLDLVRKESERTEWAQGFQYIHSLGGGTGSGLGTLCLLKLRDAYPDKRGETYSIYPDEQADTVVAPYNAILSTHQLLENSDMTYVIDNAALYGISRNKMNLKQPNFSDLNYLITHVMAGTTCSIRFPGHLNSCMCKLAVNLVPFPRLHFFTMSTAPIQSSSMKNYIKTDTAEITKEVWSAANWYCSIDPTEGKYLTTSVIYRGNFNSIEIDQETFKIQSTQSEDFVEWIPNNIKTGIVLYPCKDYPLSASFLANTTATKGMFERLSEQFTSLYKRKAFLHWYKGEGMDEMEFQEADKNVVDLITEYQDKQDAVVGGDEDEGGDDDI